MGLGLEYGGSPPQLLVYCLYSKGGYLHSTLQVF